MARDCIIVDILLVILVVSQMMTIYFASKEKKLDVIDFIFQKEDSIYIQYLQSPSKS